MESTKGEGFPQGEVVIIGGARGGVDRGSLLGDRTEHSLIKREGYDLQRIDEYVDYITQAHIMEGPKHIDFPFCAIEKEKRRKRVESFILSSALKNMALISACPSLSKRLSVDMEALEKKRFESNAKDEMLIIIDSLGYINEAAQLAEVMDRFVEEQPIMEPKKKKKKRMSRIEKMARYGGK